MACRYCWNEGHNRRSCPDLTRRLEEQAKGGNNYAAEQLAQRGKGKSKSNRTCSFCSNRGHDRRTCDRLKSVVTKNVIATQKARRMVLSNARDHGFGVGSLVKFNRSGTLPDGQWGQIETVGIVTKIDWELLGRDVLASSNSLACVVSVNYNDDGAERMKFVPLPSEMVAEADYTEEDWSAARRPEFIGPVPGPSTVPETYLSNKQVEKLIRDEVKSKKSWQFDHP